MKKAGAKSLPVAMYHYVNDHAGSITVSRAQFDDHCRVLAENGWRGVSLAEAETFLIHGEPLPEKSLLMTFDDGYLDNYLHAMPTMHKYGHKGVMFAVSQRIEQGDVPRVSIADVLAGTAPALPEAVVPMHTNDLGFSVRRDIFCNRGEIRAMEEAGVMAVASHARGHYGVYTGPEFSGFVRPRNQHRTFYRTESEFVWGMPSFTAKAGLLHRAFLPNPEMVEAVKRLVPQDEQGAAAFFAEEASVAELQALADGFAGSMGRFETDTERTERMRREIAGGKTELEAVLGHSLQTLCWPWGDYCEEAHSLGLEAGFSLFFTVKEGVNPPGRPLAVHRFKAKSKSGSWLLSRMRIYARPWLGALYARLRM